MSAMQFKTLGGTNARISVIGQGTQIGGQSTKDDPYADYERILKGGIGLGMTFIDTAPVYGGGRSEESVGRAMRGVRHEVCLATKVSPENVTCQGVLESAAASLKRLNTDYIDLYQVHWSNPAVPVAETIGAMARLIEEGKVRHIGVSNFSLKELQEAQRALPPGGIVSTQVEYNLFDRSIEDHILPYCQSENISIIAYSPLHRGKIASGAGRVEALRKIAGRNGKTPAQVALSWLLSHGPVVAIPHTTNSDRLEENAGGAFDLPGEDIQEIETICALKPLPVPTAAIRVPDADGQPVYRSVDEALENRFGSVPSPVELAEQIKAGEFLKPVRLLRHRDDESVYDLMEGKIRYWAWVIAHDGKTPIPALVEDAN